MIDVSSRRKSIQRRVIDNVNIRHLFQSRGDFHLLNHIVETRMVGRLYLFRASHSQQNAVTLEIGNKTHNSPEYQGNDQSDNGIVSKNQADEPADEH